jgi:hypothetical protein
MAGRLQLREQRMRLAFFGCSLAWLGHNLLMRSTFGLASDVLTLSGIAVGLWRYRRGTATETEAWPPTSANDNARHRRVA